MAAQLRCQRLLWLAIARVVTLQRGALMVARPGVQRGGPAFRGAHALLRAGPEWRQVAILAERMLVSDRTWAAAIQARAGPAIAAAVPLGTLVAAAAAYRADGGAGLGFFARGEPDRNGPAALLISSLLSAAEYIYGCGASAAAAVFLRSRS